VANPRSGLDALLDLVVFAPVGLLVGVREVVPELAERGRRHVESQLRLARLVGDLVTQQARAFWPSAPAGDRPPAASPSRPSEPRSPAMPRREEVIPVRLHPVDGDGDRGGAGHLAIPDYDSLAASQVVPRLAGLTAEELDAVKAYEQAHRGRATVLGRIAQLQAH
jgi:hypothetical protein